MDAVIVRTYVRRSDGSYGPEIRIEGTWRPMSASLFCALLQVGGLIGPPDYNGSYTTELVVTEPGLLVLSVHQGE